jgi:hypothetical protein
MMGGLYLPDIDLMPDFFLKKVLIKHHLPSFAITLQAKRGNIGTPYR